MLGLFSVLLQKRLIRFGIRVYYTNLNGSILDWIWDYLSDHEQNILLEGYSSTKQNTNAGVPQGSAFGLFLILIYINDITVNFENQIWLFTDDNCRLRCNRTCIFNKWSCSQKGRQQSHWLTLTWNGFWTEHILKIVW